MSAAMERQRYTPERPCPVCNGHERYPRGQGKRCIGFRISHDGREYAFCSREEHAGGLPLGDQTSCYRHLLDSKIDTSTGTPYPCKCGVVHGENVESRREYESRRSGTGSRGPAPVPIERGQQIRSQKAAGAPNEAPDESRGFRPDSEISELYDYTDANGTVAYQQLRFGEPKDFRPRHLDERGKWKRGLPATVPRYLYRLPDVIRAVDAGDRVWIVEGEKDVATLEALDQVATTAIGGAGSIGEWSKGTYTKALRGAEVAIIQDIDPEDDPKGQKLARAIYEAVLPVARSVRIYQSRTRERGGDVTDHVAAGHGLQDLEPVWPRDDAYFEWLRAHDAIRWKREILNACQGPDDQSGPAIGTFTFDEAMADPDNPTWPSGLKGGVPGRPDIELARMFGLTLLYGKASSAKTFLALAAALDSALWGGWRVIYLVAEMSRKKVVERAQRYCKGPNPSEFIWAEVLRDKVTLQHLTDAISEQVTNKKVLVVMDSLSSFVDQMDTKQDEKDAFGIKLTRDVVMWARRVKAKSCGHISFLLISQTNQKGTSFGGFADFKADLSIRMEPTDDTYVKVVTVEKNNDGPCGRVGNYTLDPYDATLTLS